MLYCLFEFILALLNPYPPVCTNGFIYDIIDKIGIGDQTMRRRSLTIYTISHFIVDFACFSYYSDASPNRPDQRRLGWAFWFTMSSPLASSLSLVISATGERGCLPEHWAAFWLRRPLFPYSAFGHSWPRRRLETPCFMLAEVSTASRRLMDTWAQAGSSYPPAALE